MDLLGDKYLVRLAAEQAMLVTAVQTEAGEPYLRRLARKELEALSGKGYSPKSPLTLVYAAARKLEPTILAKDPKRYKLAEPREFMAMPEDQRREIVQTFFTSLTGRIIPACGIH